MIKSAGFQVISACPNLILSSMPVNCSVPGCYNNSKKNPHVKFHSFPADVELRYKWASVIKEGKPWGKPITPYTKVCSDHFEVTNYSPSLSGLSMVLSKDAIPSPQRLPRPELRPEYFEQPMGMVPHLSAVCKTRRKTSVKDARNYVRDDWSLSNSGTSGQQCCQNVSGILTSALKKPAEDITEELGFMPVEVILRTYEDFDDLLETKHGI